MIILLLLNRNIIIINGINNVILVMCVWIMY